MFEREDKITWHELDPNVQSLFLGLETQRDNARQALNDEIARETKATDDIIASIDTMKSDQFGLAGIRGQVVKYGGSGQPLYADDHFFKIEKDMGVDPAVFYEYDMDTGFYTTVNGTQKELPPRSFLYEDSSERLWYYVKPGKYFKIKERYSKVTDTSTVFTNANLYDSGFDTYDQHVRYFKIYDNGWCEQVGAYSHYNPDMEAQDRINYYNRYVRFAVPYKDINYIVTLGGEIWPLTAALCSHGYGTFKKYTEKMHVSICGNAVNVHWRYSAYHVAGFIDLDAYKQSKKP